MLVLVIIAVASLQIVIPAVHHLLLQANLTVAPNHMAAWQPYHCVRTQDSDIVHFCPLCCCCAACTVSPQAFVWGA